VTRVAGDRRFTLRGDRLLRDLDALAKFGALKEGGISRPAFSPAFQQAAEWLTARMTEAGLSVRMDAAGNIIGRMGPPGPAVVCGSHIDTVPGGGHLDGALGVLAGLECARALAESGIPLERALEIIAFADEEGAYVSLLGSKAMMGDLHPERIAPEQFRTLAAAMASAGLDAARIAEAKREPSEISAYLEIHIEQGPVLENAGIEVGLVESIVGMDLLRYRMTGEARHAGSTPMDVRRDAARGACEAVTAAFTRLESEGLSGSGRMTFGNIKIVPGASNVVPAEAIVTSEVRAGSQDLVERLRALVDASFDTAAKRHGLLLSRENHEIDEAAPLDPEIVGAIGRVADKIGRPFIRMPSGACHDAQIVARKVPAGMIFVASRDGISHHPAEFSGPTAIIAGTELLLHALADLVFTSATS
jgi:beta-ureidopropionase / N-carbamoyl-L-amino-acid hydrolase